MKQKILSALLCLSLMLTLLPAAAMAEETNPAEGAGSETVDPQPGGNEEDKTEDQNPGTTDPDSTGGDQKDDTTDPGTTGDGEKDDTSGSGTTGGDGKDETTGGSGNDTQTPETPAEISVVPANLTAVEGAQAPAYGHADTYTAALAEKAITVTATGLEKTKNAANPSVESYWVGVGLTKQENASYAWDFGTAPSEFTANTNQPGADRVQTVDGKDYVTFYFSQDTQEEWTANKTGYISVKVGETVTTYTIAFNVTVKEEKEETPAAGALTFAALADTFKFEAMGNKLVSDLVETGLKAELKGTTVTVTGAAKYAAWTEFNGNTADKEQEGHYLPIQIKGAEGQKIKVVGTKTKELTFGNDQSIELAMFLDKLTDKTFEVVLTGDQEVSYKVDCSGVTLLPKAADGTTVTSKPGAGDSTGTVEVSKDSNKVELPEDLASGTGESAVDLSKMVVKVDAVAQNNSVQLKNDTPADVKTAIAANTSKIVEVTIRNIQDANAAGTEKNLFNNAAGLPTGKTITVTIGGLTSGKTYHVFCVSDDSSVSYYGYKTASGDTLAFQTRHLCHFAAVEETDSVKNAVAAMTVEEGTGLEGSTGSTPATSTYTRSENAALNKVTISGKANTYYIIQATNAKNAAPGLIYCVKADGNGKAEAYCNASSELLVLEGTATTPDFTNGVPANLTEVSEA